MGGKQTKLTLQEKFRLVKRELNKSIRELDRERARLENEESQMRANLRKSANSGDIMATKTIAKDMVRLKNHKAKFYQMRSQLQSMSIQLQTVKSTHAMGESLKTIPKLMHDMNQSLNIPRLQEIMKQFALESERLGFTQEMLGDVIEAAAETGVSDEETEEQIVAQVLEEVGVDLSQKLLGAPQPKLTTPNNVSINQVSQSPQKTALDCSVEAEPSIQYDQLLEERINKLKA